MNATATTTAFAFILNLLGGGGGGGDSANSTAVETPIILSLADVLALGEQLDAAAATSASSPASLIVASTLSSSEQEHDDVRDDDDDRDDDKHDDNKDDEYAESGERVEKTDDQLFEPPLLADVFEQTSIETFVDLYANRTITQRDRERALVEWARREGPQMEVSGKNCLRFEQQK